MIYQESQMLDMELHDLVFSLLGFGPALSLIFPCHASIASFRIWMFILNIECWKYVI